MALVILHTAPLRMLWKKKNYNKTALYQHLVDQGLECCDSVFDALLDVDTFDVEFNVFISIVNSTRIPHIFYLNKEMADLCNTKSVVPEQEWKCFSIDLKGFLEYCKDKYNTIEEAAGHLGIARNTFSNLLKNKNESIKKTRISICTILGWIFSEEKKSFIHDANFMYVGDSDKDIRMLDNLEAKMVAEDITDFNRQDIIKARLFVHNNYSYTPNNLTNDDIELKNEMIMYVEEQFCRPEISRKKRLDNISEYARHLSLRINSK